MSRNLLSEIGYLKVYSTQGTFATTDTVTIDLYPNGSGTIEPVTSNSCVEIDTTGNFYFDLGNITTPPTALTEYYWVMADTTTKKESGLIVFGGWVESVEPLGAADTCKVTVSLYDGDGIQIVEPNDLYDQTEVNTITIKNSLFASSRYFKIGAYKPSFDALTGTAFWVFPQGASVDIKLATFGISETGITIPAETTIDLNALINL